MANTSLGSRATAETLARRLKLPVMAGPMFIASTTELLVAQCRAGIVGALPALNPRCPALLREALDEITQALARDENAAPFAINIVAQNANTRSPVNQRIVAVVASIATSRLANPMPVIMKR